MMPVDVSSHNHSRLVSKSPSSSSSSSSFHQTLQPSVAVTAPVFAHHSQSTTADTRFQWSSSADEQHQRLSQVAAGNRRTSLQQVFVRHQASPETGFSGSPSVATTGANCVILPHESQESAADMKRDSFLLHDQQVVDEYNLACKNGVRSYVNLTTSGTVGGSGGFTDGHMIN